MTFSASFLAWAKQEADRPYIERDHADALCQLAAVRLNRITAPVNPDASDGALRELAARRAEYMLDNIAALREPVTLEWLNAEVQALEAGPLPPFSDDEGPIADQLATRVRRACCRFWWTRRVKRAATRKREAREQAAGRVSVRRAPYVGDDTAARYVRQQARNIALLERTEIESAAGEVVALAAASEASTSNPAIRRGELMTRIRGCEEWAQALGMVGIFTTNTLPSRFHAQHFKGGKNAKFDGSTPRQGQEHQRKTWARCRSALKRAGVKFFGFRVAEPHHDGCPHWHMLLWVGADQAQLLTDTLREYWMADSPDESGAEEHRFKVEAIDPAKGGAISYIAKYIAKNIDDAGAVAAEGHEDKGETIKVDGDGNAARRVLAWASAWGIRQFQAIGQPPVTVWRELRRVDSSAVQGASPSLRAAHDAVNRVGDRLACFRAYLDAQGGAMQGRAYRLKLHAETELREGLYGVTTADRVVGVHDVQRPGEVVLSKRQQWKPRGTWTADERSIAQHGIAGCLRDLAGFARPQAAQPWTRVNNCTHRGGGIAALMGSGIVGAVMNQGPGGSTIESRPPSWKSGPPYS